MLVAKWGPEPKSPASWYRAHPSWEGSVSWSSWPIGILHEDGSICGPSGQCTELALVNTGRLFFSCGWNSVCPGRLFLSYLLDFLDHPQPLLKRSLHSPLSGASPVCQWHSGSRGAWLLWIAWSCASRHLACAPVDSQHLSWLTFLTKALQLPLALPPCQLSSTAGEVFRDGPSPLSW